MDEFTISLLASVTYSLLAKGIKITGKVLKEKLKNWALADYDIDKIVSSIEKSEINDDWSEKKIESCFQKIPELLDIVSKCTSNKQASINQNHFGSGNNEVNIKF